jgi:hypothetical protein
MGGIGSSRWKDHQKAPVVEGAREVSVAAIKPALERNHGSGVLRWTNSQTGEVGSEFVFSLSPVSEAGTRRLLMEPTNGGRKQSFQLERVRLGWYSGWLFCCPTDCGRRTRKLYALPRWMVFSCRQCAGLTYRSVQQHDSRLDLARRDPQGFIQSRSRAPKTPKSQMVTAWLVMDAQDPCRPGRSWGRKSTTPLSRMAAQWRQDYIERWGFPPEDAGRIARGG